MQSSILFLFRDFFYAFRILTDIAPGMHYIDGRAGFAVSDKYGEELIWAM